MLPHRIIIVSKILFFVKREAKKIMFAIAIFLIASLSFSLGFITGGKIISRPPLVINKELIVNLNEESAASNQLTTKGQSLFVASSRGKYYYPVDCSLAQNLSEKNKIYFQSKEEAESRGYIQNTKCEY
jgi:hypothetical protein